MTTFYYCDPFITATQTPMLYDGPCAFENIYVYFQDVVFSTLKDFLYSLILLIINTPKILELTLSVELVSACVT